MAGALTGAITRELITAIQKLGGDPATVNLQDASHVYRALRFLGADRWLLAAVGSWRDAQGEESVLQDLQRWNAGKRP